LSSDEPGTPDWAHPGEAPPPPPYVAPPDAGGWGAAPPPPYGWSGPPPVSPWAYQVAPQAPKPGIVPLRPLGVGELLDGAFTTIRRYPAATLGLAAAVMVVYEAIEIVLKYYLLHGATNLSTGSSQYTDRSQTLDAINFVIGLVVTALLSGMLAAIVGQGILGRPMSAAQAWSAVRARFWKLLGATAAIFGIQIGLAIVCVAPGLILLLAGVKIAAAILLIIGGICAVVGLIWVNVTLLFTTPVVMLEKLGVRAAIGRSRTLVRGSWWRVFGIDLLAGLIAGIISSVLVVPFALAGGLSSLFSGNVGDQFTFTNLLITAIGGFLAGTLVRPFSGGIVALLYLDRRMRAEALDLTLQAAAQPSR
jgi:Membrane domain of glycerophosphoryl diester phosphodiesterase